MPTNIAGVFPRSLRNHVIVGSNYWEKLTINVFIWRNFATQYGGGDRVNRGFHTLSEEQKPWGVRQVLQIRVITEGSYSGGSGSYPKDEFFTQNMEPEFHLQLTEFANSIAKKLSEVRRTRRERVPPSYICRILSYWNSDHLNRLGDVLPGDRWIFIFPIHYDTRFYSTTFRRVFEYNPEILCHEKILRYKRRSGRQYIYAICSFIIPVSYTFWHSYRIVRVCCGIRCCIQKLRRCESSIGSWSGSVWRLHRAICL